MIFYPYYESLIPVSDLLIWQPYSEENSSLYALDDVGGGRHFCILPKYDMRGSCSPVTVISRWKNSALRILAACTEEE